MARTPQLSREILEAALIGLEQRRGRLVAQIAEIRSRLGSPRPQGTAPIATTRPKRRMSAAGRKAIAEAARKRWAAYRQGQAGAAQKKQPAKRSVKASVAGKPAAKKASSGSYWTPERRAAQAEIMRQRIAAAKAREQAAAAPRESAVAAAAGE